jgi:hypothetical protein
MSGPRVSAADRMYLEDPIRAGWRTCELCGHEGLDVRPGIGRYTDHRQTLIVDTVIRCKDSAACRARVEAAGNAWPLT